MKKHIVKIDHLDAAYQGKVVLSDVNLQINELDFIGIIGPNGGGKTTLLKVVMGLMKPLKGKVEYSIDKTRIGYLPQGNHPDDKFPISVREVVASGLDHGFGPGRFKKDIRQQQVTHVLKKVGMETLQSRPVGDLSGGELQRTMLARAIVSSPRLLVLDEPDTHVDNRFEMELYELLRELNKTITILLVSHDWE